MKVKRIITAIIIIILVLAFIAPIFFSCTKPQDDETSESEGESMISTQETQTAEVPVVAYIPLDDRPVNIDRVVYMAGAAGFEIITPETDLFTTVLDGAPLNDNGTNYGDRAALLAWLKQVDITADYFVISLDQMLSGGLANSRHMPDADLSLEYEILDYLIELTKTNKVYFFDTVMRLASTVGFNGYTLDEYSKLRVYGMQARPLLSGDDLTVDKIIAGYAISDTNGLSADVITAYLNSRTRKLKLIDYLLTECDRDNTYCFIGVDDSSPQNTIQTNEIAYIKQLLGDNGKLFAGADELGMMAFARFCTQYYQSSPTIGIRYYGGGENEAADSFDIETLDENLKKHITSLGLSHKTAEDGDLCVLVLTRSANITTAVTRLLDKAAENIANNIPTVIIDCSDAKAQLGNKLYELDNLPMILGYSSWNTVGNSIGIALAQGVSRYLYLNQSVATDFSNQSFLKSLAFSYCKDIGYKVGANAAANSYVTSIFGSTGNFYNKIGSAISADALSEHLTQLIYGDSALGRKYMDALSHANMITSLGDNIDITQTSAVIVRNAVYPWYRTFEIRFEISVE